MTRSMAATTVEGMADECICYMERQIGGLLSYQHAVLGICCWNGSVWHGMGQVVWN